MQQPVIYVLILLACVVLGISLALFVARRGFVPGATALIALILAAALWSLGYALEIQFNHYGNMLFWARVQYLGITVIPAAWLVFVCQYLGLSGWPAWLMRRWGLLALEPLLVLALVWTNESHGLVWQKVQVGGPLNSLAIEHGPLFWVHLVYSYLLLLSGSFLLARGLSTSLHLLRWQIRLAMLAILIPWAGNLAYVSGWNPVPGLDWTPLSFTLAGLFLTMSLSRFQLVNILPIAQKTVYAGLVDSLLVLDRQDNILEMNAAARKLAGAPADMALGVPLGRVLPWLVGWVEQAGRQDELQTEIQLGEEPDRRIYDVHITPLWGPYPLPVGRLVALHEITQLKREHALAEKRFEELVEAAPDALLLVDPQGKILLANAQAERLFGCMRAELVGGSLTGLMVESSCLEYESRLAQLLSGAASQPAAGPVDFTAVRKDGTQFPAEISLGSLSTGEGVWVACTLRDTTERKQAEAALQESMQTYRALFENAGDAIFLVGLEGEILQANQKAADLLGYSRTALQALTLKEIVMDEEYPDVAQKMDQLLSGTSLLPYVRRYRSRTGKAIPAEVNMVAVCDSSGKPLFFQSIGRDISDRLRAEQAQNRLVEEIQRSREQLRALAIRLQEVQEIERRQLAAELHDRVGQNLTGLSLNLQVIQNQLKPIQIPAVHKRLDDSLGLVEATTRKVRDVMADLHSPLLDEYGLVSTLEWYVRLFSERTGIPAVVSGAEFTPRLPPRDESVLFRMVQEALNNVAKHAQARHVCVQVESIPGGGSLSVEDDGVGFNPASLNDPCEPLHWGLLTMQQQAVSLHGQLIIDSAPGAGTRITVRFARVPDGSSHYPG